MLLDCKQTGFFGHEYDILIVEQKIVETNTLTEYRFYPIVIVKKMFTPIKPKRNPTNQSC